MYTICSPFAICSFRPGTDILVLDFGRCRHFLGIRACVGDDYRVKAEPELFARPILKNEPNSQLNVETWREQHLQTWDQLAEARKRQLEKQGKSTEDNNPEVI